MLSFGSLQPLLKIGRCTAVLLLLKNPSCWFFSEQKSSTENADAAADYKIMSSSGVAASRATGPTAAPALTAAAWLPTAIHEELARQFFLRCNKCDCAAGAAENFIVPLRSRVDRLSQPGQTFGPVRQPRPPIN